MRKKRILAGLLTAALSVSLLFQTGVSAAEEASGTGITTNSLPGWPQGPEIASTAAVVMEGSTNTVLYAKNMDQTLFPAAMVKIMTVLVALENSSMEDQVTMTATGVSGVTDGGANISAQLDEVLTMEQCLYAIMLASANDVALQVAEYVGGSVEKFVEMMNQKAQDIGCKNTLFTNPTGLPDENQHTTAYDMALITKAAMLNEDFKQIFGASSYTIPATNMSGGERALTNSFTMISPSSTNYYEGCLGGKEGATTASGSTLACAAQKNGMSLVAVILQGSSEQTPGEAATLLDYGYNNFQKLSLGENDFNLVSGGTVIIPSTASASDISVKDEQSDGKIKRQYLYKGTQVGTAIIENVKEEDSSAISKGEENMQAAYDFTSKKSMTPYYIIASVGGILFILLILLMIKVIRTK